MLDTNIISDLVRNPRGTAFGKIAEVGSEALCVSIITAAELRFGCAKSGSKRLFHHVDAILGAIDVIPFDAPADAEYGGIRAELEAASQSIGANDLLIAAHAMALGAVLVTANVREFSRVRG